METTSSKENQQELMFKLSMFEQEIQQIQQQLQTVEQGIVEMNSLNIGLDGLKGSVKKEILAPIGRGIFAKAELISEDLIVDVGGKNFVKKNIKETQELIKNQIQKLEEAKKSLMKSMDEVNKELTSIIMSNKK